MHGLLAHAPPCHSQEQGPRLLTIHRATPLDMPSACVNVCVGMSGCEETRNVCEIFTTEPRIGIIFLIVLDVLDDTYICVL